MLRRVHQWMLVYMLETTQLSLKLQLSTIMQKSRKYRTCRSKSDKKSLACPISRLLEVRGTTIW